MSIKSELKANFQQAKANQNKKERDLECEAKKMIEEFIIPKFRDIAKTYPLSPCLSIKFYYNIGGRYYTSNIDSLMDRKKSPYDYHVVYKAIELAEQFDIEADSIDDGEGGRMLSFVLNLE